MSEPSGQRMPEELLRAFDGEDLEMKVGPAHLLVTADQDGAPRPCMLSAGELLAVDDRTLRVALWPRTRTGDNLARGAPALLCYVTPGTVVYVRGTSRALPGPAEAGVAAFQIDVASVESDAHPGLPVTAGLTYGLEGLDAGELVERWRRQLDALRQA